METARPPRARARAGAEALACAGLWLGACALLGACGGGGGSSGAHAPAEPPVYASRVVFDGHLNPLNATAADWPYFFQPTALLGPPGGTLDVFSLGWDPAASNQLGGSVVLGFGDAAGPRCIVDGPGADFVVYENPFLTVDAQGNRGTNSDVATVEVAQAFAGPWVPFVPRDDPAFQLVDPARYGNLAGVTPTDQGGDAFDLQTLGTGAPAQVCYVRLTDGGTRWPDYGNTQTDAWDSGADLDAVQANHTVAAPGLTP